MLWEDRVSFEDMGDHGRHSRDEGGCWLTVVGFKDHCWGCLRFVSVELTTSGRKSYKALRKGNHLQ